jgi:cytochrome c-type biogenesis protein CcmF
VGHTNDLASLLKEPPAWAWAVGNAGRFLIWASIAFFVIALASWWASTRRPGLERIGGRFFAAGGFSILGAMTCLAVLVFTHRFEYSYVFRHSDSITPNLMQIGSLWAGQEGSFLLWASCAAIFGLLAVGGTRIYRRGFTIAYSLFLGAITGILAYESPFRVELLDGRYAPPEGRGMVPALMNYWVSIHPPTIFLGFGSLTVISAYAIAALVSRDHDTWVRQVRPWAILSTTLTGLGLCMGGFWAYETLGWGGFWAWDPVENTSFVPWIWCIVLTHGIFVQLAKNKWHWANLLVGGTTLLTFVYGTFLTRSGFLKDTSVHSFAEMNRNALWVLVTLLTAMSVVFILIWTAKLVAARKAAEPTTLVPDESIWNRTTAYGAGIWLLLATAFAAGIGMSVPLFQAIAGQKPKIVEEWLYHQVLGPIVFPILLLMGIAPLLTWRGLTLRQIATRLSGIFAVSLGMLGLMMIFLDRGTRAEYKPLATETVQLFAVKVPLIPWMLLLAWLCFFAMVANFWRMTELARRTKLGVGGLVTHIGVVMTLLGLFISRGLEKKVELVVQRGTPGIALGYLVELQDTKGVNFAKRENQVAFRFKGLRNDDFTSKPILFYTFSDQKPEGSPTVRPDVHMRLTHDIYVTLYPMAFEAGDPMNLNVNQTGTLDELKIRYLGMKREGEAGMLGTKFIAELEIDGPSGKQIIAPAMGIGGGQPQFFPMDYGRYTVALNRMDAASKSIEIQVYYKDPLFPMDVYYKPLTGLVWLGTGIMTLGGLMAAFYRRNKPKDPEVPSEGDPTSSKETDQDALVTTA